MSNHKNKHIMQHILEYVYEEFYEIICVGTETDEKKFGENHLQKSILTSISYS
jgi:hypothetical protein